MAQSFESWWNSQGPVTKFTLCVCILLTALSSFGYVSMFDYLLTYELLFREPWRIFTSTFYFGDFGIGFVFNLAFLVIYQKRLEDEDYPLGFHGRTADHVWLMLAIVLVLVPLALLMNLPIISVSFSMGIVWIWCKRHEDQELTFYGFSFKAAYFPWVLTLIHMLMGASPLRGIAGIVSGHVYIVFKDVVPNTHGWKIMETPQFMYNIFPPQRVGVTSVGGAQTYVPDARAGNVPQAQAPHRWGPGRRLAE